MGKVFSDSAISGLSFYRLRLIMLQPDLGSTVIMIVSAFVILFVAGYPLRFFHVSGVGGIAAFVALIAAAPYRLDRIKSYIDPWNDPLGTGFQGIQSLLRSRQEDYSVMDMETVVKSILFARTSK